MEKYFEILQKSPLFQGISESEIFTVLGCLNAKVFRYGKKEAILAEGEPARYIGIVLNGSVQIIRDDYFGNRSIVSVIGPCELFGESFACAGVSSIPVSAIATDDTAVLLIDCLKIICSCSNACAFHQQIIYNLLKVVAEKNLIFHQKIEVTSKRTTREKLITYLLLQAKRNHSNCFEIPYNRQELADYLEVERSGLSVVISKLSRQGMIEVNGKSFKLIRTMDSDFNQRM